MVDKGKETLDHICLRAVWSNEGVAFWLIKEACGIIRGKNLSIMSSKVFVFSQKFLLVFDALKVMMSFQS